MATRILPSHSSNGRKNLRPFNSGEEKGIREEGREERSSRAYKENAKEIV